MLKRLSQYLGLSLRPNTPPQPPSIYQTDHDKIIWAIISDNITTLQDILSKGVHTNYIPHYRDHVIYRACMYGNFEMVPMLVKAGFKIVNSEYNILFIACHSMPSLFRIQTIDCLIANGADVNNCWSDDNMPLAFSICLLDMNGKILQHLIDRGMNINIFHDGYHILEYLTISPEVANVKEHIINILLSTPHLLITNSMMSRFIHFRNKARLSQRGVYERMLQQIRINYTHTTYPIDGNDNKKLLHYCSIGDVETLKLLVKQFRGKKK